MSSPAENRLISAFRFSPAAIISLAIILFWTAIAIIGPWIAPHSPGRIVDFDVFGPMSASFPAGSDYMGRDMLSRIIVGTRYTVGISVTATLIASFVGTFLGLFAAVSGGAVDSVLSRAMDTLISLPSTIFALVIVAGLGSSIPVLIGASAFLYTPGIYRVARAVALTIVVQDFVTAARARGEGKLYIMLREVLPNMLPPVLTDFGVRFVYIMLLISGLGFLGLGVQPPEVDWGTLVYENLAGVGLGAPAAFLPAFCVVSLALAVNLFLDSIGDRAKAGSSEL
ncbi:ABC transporter permease [Chelativorans sp. J32]|uniref:ABC transporter permease n=1 Tax=Chelativorans sp. J32 TaxID=935840 RepID=UPI0004AFBF24|nr:ABC transporter permease [Chelativorans sp. J32]